MDTKLKRLPKSRVELTITVPAEHMAGYFASAFQDLAAELELPGFRKGHVPDVLARERIGEQRLTEAAVDRALPRTYTDAIREEKLIPLGEPTVHVTDVGRDKPFAYTAEVDVFPAVDPANYQAVRVSAKKYAAEAVKPAEVDAALFRLRRAASTTAEVERPAQQGDLVEVTYAGTVQGVARENLQSKNHPIIIGEGMVVAGFEEALIGMKIGEEKTVEVAIPTPDNKTEQATFLLKLEKVSEIQVPELDHELAKRFGKASPAEVRAAIEQQLTETAERDAHAKLENAVIEAVLAKVKVDLPETFIQHEIHRQFDRWGEELQRMGQTVGQWLAREKKTRQEFLDEIRPQAELAVKTSLTLRAIAEKEGFLPESAASKEDQTKVIEKTVHHLVEQATR